MLFPGQAPLKKTKRPSHPHDAGNEANARSDKTAQRTLPEAPPSSVKELPGKAMPSNTSERASHPQATEDQGKAISDEQAPQAPPGNPPSFTSLPGAEEVKKASPGVDPIAFMSGLSVEDMKIFLIDDEVLAANESVVTSSEKFKDNEAAAADFTARIRGFECSPQAGGVSTVPSGSDV